jgi:hypothetical protein
VLSPPGPRYPLFAPEVASAVLEELPALHLWSRICLDNHLGDFESPLPAVTEALADAHDR